MASLYATDVCLLRLVGEKNSVGNENARANVIHDRLRKTIIFLEGSSSSNSGLPKSFLRGAERSRAPQRVSSQI